MSPGNMQKARDRMPLHAGDETVTSTESGRQAPHTTSSATAVHHLGRRTDPLLPQSNLSTCSQTALQHHQVSVGDCQARPRCWDGTHNDTGTPLCRCSICSLRYAELTESCNNDDKSQLSVTGPTQSLVCFVATITEAGLKKVIAKMPKKFPEMSVECSYMQSCHVCHSQA